MSKAVLAIDMPNTCGECPICASYAQSAFSPREYWCAAYGNADVDPNFKAEWCPLKPLPEKEEVSFNDWTDGYNACLNDILEGYEK